MNTSKGPGFLRYYGRKKLELRCRVITPLFLGNARQEAEWRAAPFKALLRSWWRVSQARSGPGDLFAKEAGLFGAAGEAGEIKSLVEVRVAGGNPPSRDPLGIRLGKVFHPELDRPADKKILPLSYLAGMGLMKPDGQVNHSYFPANSTFTLFLDFPSVNEGDLKPALALIKAFGALGARCRNGWGSLQIEAGLRWTKEELSESLKNCTQNWQDSFAQDYPHCLGIDNNRPLLWRTNPHPTWGEAMRQLAEAYIAIRAGKPDKNIPRLEPEPGFAERHLLGVPLTHHAVSIDRHASPLRFVIRQREGNQFQGLVLHLPFSFAKAPSPFDKTKQIEVWKKVHQGLDQLLTPAASYGECL